MSASWDVPTKKYSIPGDVDALALFLAQRQSDSATTNGGIVASGGGAPVPQLGVSADGQQLAYFKAMADAALAACAVQQENAGSFTLNTTPSLTFVDVPGSSITFTEILSQKTRHVACDFSFFFSSTALGAQGAFRLVINGSNGPTRYVYSASASANLIQALTLRHMAQCSAGANTIKLQWLVAVNTSTLAVNTNCDFNYVVSG